MSDMGTGLAPSAPAPSTLDLPLGRRKPLNFPMALCDEFQQQDYPSFVACWPFCCKQQIHPNMPCCGTPGIAHALACCSCTFHAGCRHTNVTPIPVRVGRPCGSQAPAQSWGWFRGRPATPMVPVQSTPSGTASFATADTCGLHLRLPNYPDLARDQRQPFRKVTEVGALAVFP